MFIERQTMTIPLNNIVKINPGVLAVGNNGNNLFGLMLTKSGVLPSSQITTITNADQIGKLFGYNSTEYDLATVYFSGFTDSDRVASQLYIAPYYEQSSSASIIGGNVAYYDLSDFQSLSGDLTIVIDGQSKTVQDLDFSKVTSASDAASVLGNALGCTVTYTTSTYSFVVTSLTTGSNSNVGFATGTLADGMKLTQEYATQSPSTNNQSLTDLLKTLRSQNTAFCSVFLTWEGTDNEKMELAKWSHSMNDDVCVILNDTSKTAIVAQTGASFAEKVNAVGYEGVVCVYDNLELCAFIAGYPAAWDLTKTDGRFTAAFRRNNLLTANVTDEMLALTLKSNGYNFYGVWASATSNFTFMYEGRISGQYLWLDSWFCQVWMRRLLQYYFMKTLLAKGQIPYNDTGKGYIQTSANLAISQFLNFGAIRTGILLSDDQTQSLKQFGLNQSQINNITSIGYYLRVDMNSVTPQNRVARGSPPINFWYTDGQSVQQIIMNSIEIQ